MAEALEGAAGEPGGCWAEVQAGSGWQGGLSGHRSEPLHLAFPVRRSESGHQLLGVPAPPQET